MIQIQFRITVAPDGGTKIEMDRLEREDATAEEREVAAGIHDLSMVVLGNVLGQLDGVDVDATIIDAAGARPMQWGQQNA